MAKNDFKAFATDRSANVISQEEWEALPALLSGFTAGKASSAQVNKVIRQASFIAAALAQFVSDKTQRDVLDNGDLPGFVELLGSGFAVEYLSRKNPFGDIKSDGTVQTALENLGLGEAAKRDVGTGDNQIPDMGAFASGSGWFRLPGGYIVQFGTFSGNTTRFISGHFPIPFPNQPMVSVSVMSDAVQSDPSNPAPQVLSVNFEHISNSAWRVATSDISQQYRFSYISIGR
ncbi:gp53-like domain-containing protein [Escherichia coli]